MKKLLLVKALLFSGLLYSQSTQKFGNWEYEYAEYQHSKYTSTGKVEWITKQSIGASSIDYMEVDKGFGKQPMLKINMGGMMTGYYFIMGFEELEDGYFFELMDRGGKAFFSLLIIEGEEATMMFDNLKEKRVFYVKKKT